MTSMETLFSELRAEADIDFLDLSFVADSVRARLNLHDQEQIHEHTLAMLRRLMGVGIHPGDYTLDDLTSGRGFQFRSGTPDEVIAWIEAEWEAMGHAPTQEQPICWLALRK